MKFAEHEELLSAYADGELSGDEKDFVERLLKTDPEANKFYRETLVMKDSFADFPRFALPENFADHCMDAIERRSDTRPLAAGRSLLERLTRPRIWIYPLASLVALALLVPILTTDSLRPAAESPQREQARRTESTEPTPAMPEPVRPFSLTEEERAKRLTPAAPMAEGAPDRPSVPTTPIETVAVTLTLADGSTAENTRMEFTFALQKITEELGVGSFSQRKLGHAAVYELTVTQRQFTTLLEQITLLPNVAAEHLTQKNSEQPETADDTTFRVALHVRLAE